MAAITCARGGRGPTEGDLEAVARFENFLRLRAAIAARIAAGRYVEGEPLPAWQRYALRLSAWRMTKED